MENSKEIKTLRDRLQNCIDHYIGVENKLKDVDRKQKHGNQVFAYYYAQVQTSSRMYEVDEVLKMITEISGAYNGVTE